MQTATLAEALPEAPGGGGSRLPPLLAELKCTSTSFLEPAAFFVSWQGVLTLAYRGFTLPLVDLKRRISAAHQGLPPENPGSKWPKSSLGCLRDGKRLTPLQLDVLCQICREVSAASFQQRPAADAASGGNGGNGNGGNGNGGSVLPLEGQGPPAIKLSVNSAAVVLFECRSLERLLSCQHIAFQGGMDEAAPPVEELNRVESILEEPNAPDYWFAASRDGNREAHYRGQYLGATLIHTLAPEVYGGEEAASPGVLASRDQEAACRSELLAAVDRFRQRVDSELPGMYAWFADSSLHITLRALIG